MNTTVAVVCDCLPFISFVFITSITSCVARDPTSYRMGGGREGWDAFEKELTANMGGGGRVGRGGEGGGGGGGGAEGEGSY